MKTTFANETLIKVRLSSGKSVSMRATRARNLVASVNPDKRNPDRKKEVEARKDGKQYLFNMARGIWQAVDVVSVVDPKTNEFVDFTPTVRNYPKRMSLNEAIEYLAQFGFDIEKDGKTYLVSNPAENIGPYTRTGIEVVRFAREMAPVSMPA